MRFEGRARSTKSALRNLATGSSPMRRRISGSARRSATRASATLDHGGRRRPARRRTVAEVDPGYIRQEGAERRGHGLRRRLKPVVDGARARRAPRHYACGAVFAWSPKARRAFFVHPGADRRQPRQRRVNTADWLAALDRASGKPACPATSALSTTAIPSAPIAACSTRAASPSPVADGMPSCEADFEHASRGPEHIDELGHVNNAVWVQWIQELVAVAHWRASPIPPMTTPYFWVVVRHEIDYLRAAGRRPGHRPDLGRRSAEGRALRPPHGVRRRGRQAACVAHDWAIIDKASGRPDPRPSGSHSAVLDAEVYGSLTHDAAHALRLLPLVRLPIACGSHSTSRASTTSAIRSTCSRASRSPRRIARSTRRAWCRCSRSTATGSPRAWRS